MKAKEFITESTSGTLYHVTQTKNIPEMDIVYFKIVVSYPGIVKKNIGMCYDSLSNI